PSLAHAPILAEKIRQAKATVEGERKQVTVLFVDMAGSMELAEQLDPEAWSQIMQRFFRIFSDCIGRFEGFVDKFTGDGGMALFGAPIAHEGHAQRACYAALHLRDATRTYASEVRALVLCAQGKSFCAGADFANRPATGASSDGGSGKHLYKEATRIFRTRKPIVAAVQGAAIGGGLGLALAADFRVTCSEARFSA